MEVKTRRIPREIVDRLDSDAKKMGISREEIIRRILNSYVEGKELIESPLSSLLKEQKDLLHEVRFLMMSIINKLEI